MLARRCTVTFHGLARSRVAWAALSAFCGCGNNGSVLAGAALERAVSLSPAVTHTWQPHHVGLSIPTPSSDGCEAVVGEWSHMTGTDTPAGVASVWTEAVCLRVMTLTSIPSQPTWLVIGTWTNYLT